MEPIYNKRIPIFFPVLICMIIIYYVLVIISKERGAVTSNTVYYIIYKYIFAAILSSRARAFTRGRYLRTICPEQLASDIMADDVYLLYAYYYIGNNVYLHVYEYNLYEMKRKKGYVCKNK